MFWRVGTRLSALPSRSSLDLLKIRRPYGCSDAVIGIKGRVYTRPFSKSGPPLKKDNDFVTKGHNPTPAEQRRSDWGITKRLLVNVWPKNDWKTRSTVLLGLGLLVSSKVSVDDIFNGMFYKIYFTQLLNVQVPQIFKNIVDSLNVDITASSTAWLLAGSLILGCPFFFLCSL